jgi:vacuolar-type H+-ATPase subunit C/Vma6
MAIDVTYTNGVIAAREKYLLKEKIFRLCELTAEDAFRSLVESGYGNAAVVSADPYAFEELIKAEEESVDKFIREYAPSKEDRAYLLSPRDFHNAKALLKAEYLASNVENMLAPEGEIAISVLSDCVKNRDFSALETLNMFLKKACEETSKLMDEGAVTGSQIGEIFEKFAYEYYATLTRRNKTLKKLLAYRVDATNILTAFRAGEQEVAEQKYLTGGKLDKKTLSALFLSEEEGVSAFSKTEFGEIVEACYEAKRKGHPYSNAEKLRDGYELFFFSKIKYELQRNQPFLYYVFRRRIENANVRILFVCLLAGLSEGEIKRRLRTE